MSTTFRLAELADVPSGRYRLDTAAGSTSPAGDLSLTEPLLLVRQGQPPAPVKSSTGLPVLYAKRLGLGDRVLATVMLAADSQAPGAPGGAAGATLQALADLDAAKAPLVSPAFMGTPTAPTAAAGTNTTQVATTAFTRGEVAALVASAPGTLDTLGEIAAALASDESAATALATTVASKAPLASPVFTGNPTAPTPTAGDNDTSIATTAFVKTAVGSLVASSSLVPTAVKTTNYTAASNDYVPVDTTSGGVTITLPTAPADKTQVGIKHVVRGGSNVVTFACGGSDVINKTGGSTSGTITLLNQSTVLQYKASGAIWYVVGGDLPLSQLDSRYPQSANNLSDLASAATARTNLGLAGLATKSAVAVPGDVTATGTPSATTFLRGDGSWATPAGGAAGVPLFKTRSGAYFSAPEHIAGGSSNVGVGYLCATPIIIPADVTVSSIGVNVTSATASSLVRLGIYADDGTMQPGTLVLDAGTISGATTGFKEIAISQALTAGIYWLAAVQQTAACSMTGSQSTIVIPAPSASLASARANYGIANNGGTTGALPGTFTTITFYASSGAPYPRIILKAA